MLMDGLLRGRRVLRIALCFCLSSQAGLAWSLDLLESYRLALVEDAQYGAARAALDVGREVVPIARAQLLPNISANATRYENNLESRERDSLGQPSTTESEYPSTSMSLTLRQPVYRPSLLAGYRQAKAKQGGAEAVFAKAGQDLAQRVAGAYLNILAAEEALRYAESQRRAISSQLAGAERALEAGLGTRTDVDDARARLDMNGAQELAARQQIAQRRHELETLINRSVESVTPLDSRRLELTTPMPALLDEWVARAEAGNLELQDLASRVAAARLEVERARAGHKPTLDLIARYSQSESDNVTNPDARYVNKQLGLQFDMPLYAGGYVSAQVRQAVAALSEVQERYEALRRQVATQVRKEYQAIAEGILKVRALEQAERSADQAVLSNEKGFIAGTRSRLDILNAEERRGNTRLELARERLNYVMSRIRLLGLGGALNLDEIRAVNDWFADRVAH